jgi:hypothetical protein
MAILSGMRDLVITLALTTEQNAATEMSLHRIHDRRRPVAQDHRPHAEIIVNEPIAIDVIEKSRLGTLENEREK